jgi:hypothetical protein
VGSNPTASARRHFAIPLFTYNDCTHGFTVVPGALRWVNGKVYQIIAHEGPYPDGHIERAPVGFLDSLDVMTDADGTQTVWAMGRVTPGTLDNEPDAPMIRTLRPTYAGGIHATGMDGCQTLVQGADLVELTLVLAQA